MSRIAEAKELVDKALTDLIEALEQGRRHALLDYLAFTGRFHRYSLRNQLLIYSQDPEATQVAGFRTWKSLGRHVRKGEHGLLIIVPMPRRCRDASDEDEEAEIRFGTGYVFDVRQTDGDDLPQLSTVEGNPGEYLERLHALAASKSIEVRFREFHPIFERGIQGISKGGVIELAKGLSPAEEFSVLTHELAHELLHRGEDAKAFSKTVLETEAEAVAHVVASGIGLQTNGASSDYISVYDGNIDIVQESLRRIQSVARPILEAVLPDRARQPLENHPASPRPDAAALLVGDRPHIRPASGTTRPPPRPPRSSVVEPFESRPASLVELVVSAWVLQDTVNDVSQLLDPAATWVEVEAEPLKSH